MYTKNKRNIEKIINSKSNTINIAKAICPECGGKIGLYIKGEPVYLCSKCQKYFGTMPFKK